MIGFGIDKDGHVAVAYDSGLVEDNSFVTDVLISLFTDRRAPNYVDLQPEDRRGWWADETWGSRLWLLLRRPLTPELLTQLRKAVEECLDWMLAAKILSSVTVTAERVSRDAVRLAIALERGEGETWAVTWKMTAERVEELAVQGPNA